MNRVIVDMMRHYISPTQDDWDEHLTAIEFAINNAHQQSIGSTPFRLTYGQNPLTPVSLKIPKVENPTALQVTETLQERLRKAKQPCSDRRHTQTRTEDLLSTSQVMKSCSAQRISKGQA